MDIRNNGMLPLMAVVLTVAWCNAQAHTRFATNTVVERVAHDNVVRMDHQCGGTQPITGFVLVFPDVTSALVDISPEPDAVIGAATYARSDQPATDFVANTITMRGVLSNDTFSISDLKFDDLGNPIGFWAAGGSIPNFWYGMVPLRIPRIDIAPESCANRVIVAPAAVTVCHIASAAEVDGKDGNSLNHTFWTAPDAGHPRYDALAWNGPAPLMITRNLEINPLPSNCGEGFTARIYPSPSQLDRDLPVVIDGQQVWPAP